MCVAIDQLDQIYRITIDLKHGRLKVIGEANGPTIDEETNFTVVVSNRLKYMTLTAYARDNGPGFMWVCDKHEYDQVADSIGKQIEDFFRVQAEQQ